MIKKNDRIELTITSVTSDGSGVGKNDGFAVFVPMTAVGDKILAHITKVNKNYAFAFAVKIIEPSPHRTQNFCPVFDKCGGCVFRHITYEKELELKKEIIVQNMKKLGHIDFECQKINAFSPLRYRNKGQYPVCTDESGNLATGFFAPHSHRIIPCEDCLLQPEIFSVIIKDALEFLSNHKVTSYDQSTSKGLLRHIFLRRGEASNQIMLCLVVTDFAISCINEFVATITKKHSDIKTVVLNKNASIGNTILGKEQKIIFGDGLIEDVLCDLKFKISPLSFYQVNKVAAQALYQKAFEFADFKKTDILLDLYCGAGTIGLSMAKQCEKLIGCDLIPEAIENAKQNALYNDVKNATFLCGDASDVAKKLADEHLSPTVIIIDPPRKGCESSVLAAMVLMAPEKIIMISCNSATAARDAEILQSSGYHICAMEAFDLFPRTTHVECIMLLQK